MYLVDKWVNVKSAPDSTKKIINNTIFLYVRPILHGRYDVYMVCIYDTLYRLLKNMRKHEKIVEILNWRYQKWDID